jgi:protein ImuB
MLWLALHFPTLALDVYTRGARAPSPLAIASSPGNNAVVLACNHSAHHRGVRSGMPLAAACALSSELVVMARDVAAERTALERVAAWALQFTPAVSLAHPAEVLLEIAGSLKLFGGLNRLYAQIENGLAELGYGFVLACSPTPLAAQLFARAGLPAKIRHRDALRAGLGPLSVDAFGLPLESNALLRAIGARTFDDCLRLPRDGMARRLGQKLLDTFDRALGHIPDPRPSFVPPADFVAALTLPASVHEADQLLFAARRLLAELCGFLSATGNGVQRLAFAVAHEDRAETRFMLDLTAATRDLEHLVSVLRERLGRLALPCPATAITLKSELLLPAPPHNLSLLPDSREHAEAVGRLIERLRARLSAGAVKGLDTATDYRPERAWKICEPGNGYGTQETCPVARPLWLLASPQPLREIGAMPHYQGPLAFLAGPERIESGWWDGGDVARDYFIARNPAHALLWVYRERCHDGGWYLHGFFA